MNLSPERKRLYEAAKNAKDDKLEFQRALDARLADITGRHRKGATKFRQRLIDRALAAAGIDAVALERRHSAENESLRADLEQVRPLLDEEAKRVEVRQRTRVEGLKVLRRHSPPSPPGPTPPGAVPFEVFILGKADMVDLADSGIGTTASPSAWDNSLRTKLSTNPDFVSCTANFRFFWTPPRSGILRAVCYGSANGSAEWSMDSNCWGNTMIGLSVLMSLSIQQFDYTGALNTSLPSSTFLYSKVVSHGLDDQCLGDVGATSIDALQSSDSSGPSGLGYPSEFPVLGNVDALITVSLSVDLEHESAAGVLDFLSGSRHASVLAVFLDLY